MSGHWHTNVLLLVLWSIIEYFRIVHTNRFQVVHKHSHSKQNENINIGLVHSWVHLLSVQSSGPTSFPGSRGWPVASGARNPKTKSNPSSGAWMSLDRSPSAMQGKRIGLILLGLLVGLCLNVTSLRMRPRPSAASTKRCVSIQQGGPLDMFAFCTSAGYDSTLAFPEHVPVERLAAAINSLLGIFKNCSQNGVAEAIFCSMIAPKCVSSSPNVLLPCRRVCSEFIKQCGVTMEKTYFDVIVGMCETLPDKNASSGQCLEPPGFQINENIPGEIGRSSAAHLLFSLPTSKYSIGNNRSASSSLDVQRTIRNKFWVACPWYFHDWGTSRRYRGECATDQSITMIFIWARWSLSVTGVVSMTPEQ